MSVSKSTFLPRRVLVVGTGLVGSAVSLAVAARKELSAAVLVRPASLTEPAKRGQLDKLRDAGVELLAGDWSDASSALADKLRGFDSVVCALSSDLLKGSRALLAACKAAGVRRFVASEFGSSISDIGPGTAMAPVVDEKLAVRREVEVSGLDWYAVEVGFFEEFLINPFAGVDVAAHSITAPAPLGFDARTATTPLADIGRVVAEVLARDDVRSGVIRISSGSPSYEELAVLMERVSGRPVKRSVRPRADIDAAVARGDFPSLFAANLGVQHPGMAWEQSTTWNEQNGFELQSWQEFAEQAIRQQLHK